MMLMLVATTWEPTSRDRLCCPPTRFAPDPAHTGGCEISGVGLRIMTFVRYQENFFFNLSMYIAKDPARRPFDMRHCSSKQVIVYAIDAGQNTLHSGTNGIVCTRGMASGRACPHHEAFYFALPAPRRCPCQQRRKALRVRVRSWLLCFRFRRSAAEGANGAGLVTRRVKQATQGTHSLATNAPACFLRALSRTL
jgi:hypothetical protein